MRKFSLITLAVVMVSALVFAGCAQMVPSPTPTPTPSPTPKTSPSATMTIASDKFIPRPEPAPSTGPGIPKYGGTLRVGYENDASVLGCPCLGILAEDTLLSQPAIERLVYMDLAGNLYPWLAESWTDDYKTMTVTLTLRKGIKFHDGTDFNAQAVKWNWEQLMAAKKSQVSKVKSLDIIDDYKIRVNLNSWDPSAIYNLGFEAGHEISPTAWQKNGADWGKENPVGTGPYKFVSRVRESNIKYVRNNDYWLKGKPYLDAFEFIIIKDASTRLAALKAGEIDICLKPTVDQVVELKNDPKYVIHRMPGASTYLLAGDANNPDSPMYKIQCRQALGYAVDPKALVDGVLKGYGMVATQATPPGSWSYSKNVKPYTYDPTKAKQLLAEAGYPNGFEMKLYGLSVGEQPTICTAIQSMLSQVGIKVTLDLQTSLGIENVKKTGWKNGCLLMGFGSNPGMQPYSCLSVNRSKRVVFASLLNAPELDEKIEEATSAPDFETQKVLIREVQDLIYNKYVQLVPLYHIELQYIKYPYVKDSNFYTVISHGQWAPGTEWLDR